LDGRFSHLVATIADLGKRGVNLRPLTESINTESAGGRFVLHIMAALAEFERSLIMEGPRSGLAAATERGIKLGRTPRLDEKKIAHARLLIEGGESPGDVARTRSTIA
jgi:DNA invertase Pin-like site-specific DNA recombinase